MSIVEGILPFLQDLSDCTFIKGSPFLHGETFQLTIGDFQLIIAVEIGLPCSQ